MTVGSTSDSSEDSSAPISGEWTDPQWVGSRPASFGQLEPGDIIGRCKVVRELGAGGMGAVYLATHLTLQVDVALKILPPVLAKERSEIAQRFIREAQLAARIRHPNVVSVMDADFDQTTGLYYIILEYISGGSLAQRLRQGPLPEADTLRVILDIAQALVVAAENGIVHRDIKPDNIMLDHRGVAKLADLGLAKQDFAAVTVQLTQGGASVGTPSYMSPDQIQDAQSADAQDDIYSLGATMYECLTGAPPFVAANPYNAVGQILFSPTPDPRARRSDVSPQLAAICQKMMAKKKTERYPSAEVLIEDLQALKLSSSFAALLPNWPRKGPLAAIKKGDWFYNEVVNPRRKVKLIDLVLFGTVLAVTVWVVRAMLLPDRTETSLSHSSVPSLSTPVAGTAEPVPEPSPLVSNTGETETPLRALPVESEGMLQTPAPAFTQTLAPPIALPPPEPIPGENPTLEAVAPVPGISAFQAKALAEQMVPEGVRQNIMQISGPRQPGSVTPGSWRFLFWDQDADQHVRAVTVTGDVAAPAKEGFVELGKLRVISYKKIEIIDPQRLQIDSARALEIVQATPELKEVPVTSAAYFLERGKGKLPLVWRITLFARRNGEEIPLGEVKVSAETGLIMEFGIKWSRLPTGP